MANATKQDAGKQNQPVTDLDELSARIDALNKFCTEELPKIEHRARVRHDAMNILCAMCGSRHYYA